MRRDLLVYLQDIQEYGNDILTFMAGKNLADYRDNLKLRRAVERSFEIVGEACRQCRFHFPGSLDELGNVQPIIDFRNQLAHQYEATEDQNGVAHRSGVFASFAGEGGRTDFTSILAAKLRTFAHEFTRD